jgi:hypothetical protein
VPPGEPTSATGAEELAMAGEESQALGRVATVGGAGAGSEPPMMPPMGGMGGGMGGVGGGGGKKTWVTEDEETWGTGAGASSGVIGR